MKEESLGALGARLVVTLLFTGLELYFLYKGFQNWGVSNEDAIIYFVGAVYVSLGGGIRLLYRKIENPNY